MKDILILLCSPRRNGVTDHMSRHFAMGANDHGGKITFVALRDYKITPCLSCGNCINPPHICPYAYIDDVKKIFSLILKFNKIVCASPIYFYSLPGLFKSFIDRAQRYWNMNASGHIFPQKRIMVLLSAGRSKGDQLFNGSLLTLSYFFKCFNGKIIEKALFKGVESVENITDEMKEELYNYGCDFVSDN